MSDLPPIRLSRRCPKCGGDDIHTLWVKATFANSKPTIPASMRRRLMGDRLAAEEHMARTCKTCQYKWAEAPLDQCSAVDQLGAVESG
jgi:predicted nucleic-acid-binding Zn-ribbon protein